MRRERTRAGHEIWRKRSFRLRIVYAVLESRKTIFCLPSINKLYLRNIAAVFTVALQKNISRIRHVIFRIFATRGKHTLFSII